MATRIRGLKPLQRKLKKLPDAVREAMRKAIAEGADELVALARSLVPVGASGELKDSIGWTWGEPPAGSITLGKVQAAKRASGLVATIYAGNELAFYARFIEFGTAPHPQGGMFKGTTHPGTTAQPFFYPAYRAVRKRIRGRVTRATNKAARQVAAGR